MARIIRRIIYISVAILFCITAKTFAKDLILDCPESIKTGETIECNLKGNFEGNVNAVKIRYSIPEGIIMNEFVPSGDWVLITGGTPDDTGLILRLNGESMDPNNETGEIDFGKFTFEVPSTYSKSKVVIRIYSFDATNTACEALDFEEDSITKTIEVTDNQDQNSDEEDEQNPPNTDPNGGEETKPSNPENSENPPSASEDDGNKTPSNTEDGDNKTSSQQSGENKGQGNVNSETQASTSLNNGNNKNSGTSVEKNGNANEDSSTVKTPMGQYGSKSTVVFVIIGVVIVMIVIYRKYKKMKFIK